jgi:hypothetical protein
MKISLDSFRGEAPRISPRLLPENAAQDATNARLVSGDLEAWRQFVQTQALNHSETIDTIYLLNGAWLSWTTQVDVARGIIPGDTSFRIYLTGPEEYDRPQWTNYALAVSSPGPPYPASTRPVGVPPPDSVPTLEVGVGSSPTTFSVDVLDEGDELATAWTTSPPQTGSTYSTVTQDAVTGNPAPSYLITYDEIHNPGDTPSAYRNFGIAEANVVVARCDFLFGGDTSLTEAVFGVMKSLAGAGPAVVYRDGGLSILKCTGFTATFGVAVIASTAVSLAAGVWHTFEVTIRVNDDDTQTVTARIFTGSGQVATVTATNSFELGDYCSIENARVNDSGTQFKTFYDNIHIQASGSTGFVPTNIATSYVFTFVNDIDEESAPSLPSATILRPDGVSVTVTTPTSVPTGTSSLFGIDTKRIYRAVTGNTGTIFRFVAEIPLTQADYVDTLADTELGDPLESDDWDLPPDDLEGILALPNGIMVGFRRNQLCFSVQNRPHAWRVADRLNTDTDIVGIGNIDNVVVIGTNSFPYLAFGNDPAAYSMTKLEVPQACVSKRSFAYLTGIGVVFASPDGLIAVAGTGQVRNLTETIFDRHQWQDIDPTTIIGVSHDDVYHFFHGASASPTLPPASVVWNTLNAYLLSAWVFSQSNKQAQLASAGDGVNNVVATTTRSSGKVYFEVVFSFTSGFGTSVRHDIGCTQLDPPSSGGSVVDIPGFGYRRAGQCIRNGANQLTVAASASGDTIMFAIDFDLGRVWIGNNGTWFNSGDPANNLNPVITGITAGAYRIGGSVEAGAQVTTFRLRTVPAEFLYTKPVGFNYWTQA